ncbi:helicase-related protein [Craurococcus roseus]
MRDEEAAERFVGWLEAEVLAAARGDRDSTSENDPSGKYFLGRLASEDAVANGGLGDRGERLEPCAIGLRLRPALSGAGPWHLRARVRCLAWLRVDERAWRKSLPVDMAVDCLVGPGRGTWRFGEAELRDALRHATGTEAFTAELRVEVAPGRDGRPELIAQLVNTSPDKHPDPRVDKGTQLYECCLEVDGLATSPFKLEALPDSFRYDRDVPAYGLNVGIAAGAGRFASVDAPACSRRRPEFWPPDRPEPPDLRFATLARDPIPSLAGLVRELAAWGDEVWSGATLGRRAAEGGWSPTMAAEARQAASDFAAEVGRMEAGLRLLRSDERLARAFRLMNDAMGRSAHGRYEGWRPFQTGFLLANLSSVASPSAEAGIADIVWFATGGGKTETYLGLLVTAAFHDRLRGKSDGITAWSRFPLRMLSLQQTQRFANALAGAEMVRRAERIGGAPFSLGFFVGQSSTPNSLKHEARSDDPWDPEDDAKLARAQVLDACPFCRGKSVSVAFDRVLWRLEHRCGNTACEWPERALPVFVVDDEIYRFLPTVVVGTLDKAASIAMQASMRGFVGAPLGRCPQPGHGWTYAARSSRPAGCLVPGCPAKRPSALGCDPALFGPSFRLQDELHLLRDSLGAVDSHYEALYDDLQRELCGSPPKILASSATLSGYSKQVDVLYRREARVFPQPGPSPRDNFWATPSDRLMRRYVAVAPRGVTIEYAVDRLLSVLQGAVRRLVADPAGVCAAAGVDPSFGPMLVSLYGTDVVYGNTLRDLDAVERSAETQIRVDGPVNTASLTGRTGFDEVRQVLARLDEPEPDFRDRLHVVAASSMMSHGVDVDRLNVMVMLGLPLGSAEFIQATARVGRRWPGLVLVVHKIGRERDAAVFRDFERFVEHGDRFVEPVPVTRRSRRVLERTAAGLELARLLMLHEPAAGQPLTLISHLRRYLAATPGVLARDRDSLLEALATDAALDEGFRADLAHWFELFGRNIASPPPDARFPSDAWPKGRPMLSLRDVEEQVPVVGGRTK